METPLKITLKARKRKNTPPGKERCDGCERDQ